jgi:PleD family two-component response regulator
VIVMVQPEDRSKAVEALSKGAQDYLVKGQAGSYLLGQTILRRVASKDLPPPNQRPQKKGQAAS